VRALRRTTGTSDLKQAVPLNRYLLFFALALGLAAADLVSKSLVFANLGMPGGRTQWFWNGVFGFQTSLNEGALFGFGQGLALLFAALSVAAAIGILLWLFPAGAARDSWLTVALALIMAGILGNLFDRLGLHGLQWTKDCCPVGHLPGDRAYAVRDFIHVIIRGWAWPTFNLADSALDCGAVLLLGHAFFAKNKEEESNTT
jgi:signal peptidase II